MQTVPLTRGCSPFPWVSALLTHLPSLTDAGLYSCLDDEDVAGELFPGLDHGDGTMVRALFSDGFDLDMEVVPPDPPWDSLGEPLFPELEVKSEPASPASSHCSNFSATSSSASSELLEQVDAPSPVDALAVKTEHPPTPPCMLGDVLAPPFGTVHFNVIPAPETGKPVTPSKAETILSRKPPIQPKPVVVAALPVQPATSTKTILLQSVPVTQTQTINPTITVPARSVVISQSDLLHLPVSGLLKVQSAVTDAPPAKPAPPAPKPEAKTIVPAPTQIGPCNPEVDIKVLKRQQRMIKNRESACQSRRKKKEYLQGLESRLREALVDNERLHRENIMLRRRLDCVLGEVSIVGKVSTHLPLSISERTPAAPAPLLQESTAAQSRRHLLEVKDEPLEIHEEEQPEQLEEAAPPSSGRARFGNLTAPFPDMKEMVLRDLDKLFLASDCRQFNRTESLRLVDELSGWVKRHQINRRKPLLSRKPVPTSQEPLQRKAPSPSRYVPASPPRHPERDSTSQLQLYQHPDRTEHDFMDAIDRREDTFYVVSFRRDHLLLPAISHNKTSRPKMSLVMPAMALNGKNHSTGWGRLMGGWGRGIPTVPPFLKRQDPGVTPDNRTEPASNSLPSRGSRALLRPQRHAPGRTLYLGEHGGG
uniref:Activating transcription factor 6 beta n=1 Tax=Sphenodon punctatus TaxID=8508 RepID=A0A8D0L9D8_SPHPU